MDQTVASTLRKAPLKTPTDLGQNARTDISGALTALLADVLVLYLKTKNFHWHLSGPHFRDFHLMLDDQAGQLIGMTDAIAERARKVGGTTLRSIGHIARVQRLLDNDAEFVTAEDMLAELKSDNEQLIGIMRQVHELTSEHGDIATTSLLEGWVDEAEGRVWFLFESNRKS
ncbi:Dps family protein [Neorhizobium alkalisoli]|uniref:Starvation-inducible DNA-binding protein n=1 Tax=Neorhizobium alkalisoli TaxID=528178 RepID=A0A561QC66_9HYPH|nr:DNA starvation/stationary phase protection protein [Neorhizobium alkalisoli]TWF47965.1 starvation-inducible DNA-binding protein [Neorhizobium alkalisoli]